MNLYKPTALALVIIIVIACADAGDDPAGSWVANAGAQSASDQCTCVGAIGATGPSGNDGSSCSITDVRPSSATVSCTNGTSATLTAPKGDRGDPGPAGTAAEESGTRLKARWLVGTDGSKQFLGWHDTVEDVDCVCQLASDGTQRCLPAADASWASTPVILSLYSDATCTTPVYATEKRVAVCGKLPPLPTRGWKREAKSADATCGDNIVSYALTSRTAPASVYDKSTGFCIDVSSLARDFYTLSDRRVIDQSLNPANYVQATETIDQ